MAGVPRRLGDVEGFEHTVSSGSELVKAQNAAKGLTRATMTKHSGGGNAWCWSVTKSIKHITKAKGGASQKWSCTMRLLEETALQEKLARITGGGAKMPETNGRYGQLKAMLAILPQQAPQ